MQKDQDIIQGIKVSFTIGCLALAVIGGLIIGFSGGDVWGHVICGVSVYLLSILYFPNKSRR